MCVWVFCVLSWVRENYIHCYCLFFDYYWCICLVLRFTIAHTAEEERIIVTIDCRLRFVCGEVEVCIFSSFCLFICFFVCVQSVLSEGADVAFQLDLTGKRQSAPSFVFIYMYVFYFESSKMWSAGGPKSVLVAIQILFSSLLLSVLLMNLTEFKPKTG